MNLLYKPTEEEIAARTEEMRPYQLRYYTPTEELLNTVSHAIGAVGGIVTLIVLLLAATSAMGKLTAVLFGVGVTLLYSISALYHGVTKLPVKSVLRKFDHGTINIVVISCGLPLCLLTSGGVFNYIALALCYAVTIGCFALCIINLEKFKALTFASNFVVGALLTAVFLVNRNYVPQLAKLYYIVGVAVIIIGAIMYKLKGRYVHTAFHVVVLIATMCFVRAAYLQM